MYVYQHPRDRQWKHVWREQLQMKSLFVVQRNINPTIVEIYDNLHHPCSYVPERQWEGETRASGSLEQWFVIAFQTLRSNFKINLWAIHELVRSFSSIDISIGKGQVERGQRERNWRNWTTFIFDYIFGESVQFLKCFCTICRSRESLWLIFIIWLQIVKPNEASQSLGGSFHFRKKSNLRGIGITRYPKQQLVNSSLVIWAHEGIPDVERNLSLSAFNLSQSEESQISCKDCRAQWQNYSAL